MTSGTQSVCPLCSGSVVYLAKKRGWNLWHCQACDHYAVLPTPAGVELRQIYSRETGYGSGRESKLSDTCPADAQRLIGMLSTIHIPSTTLLDVGCGDGRLIYHLRERGWLVAGNDYSPTYVAKCSQHGLNVHMGDLKETDITLGMWGVVHLGDVVEHVPDPMAFLRMIYKYLMPGGVVVVRTPNAASTFSRLSATLAHVSGTEWLASEAPMHINDFTPKSLKFALSRCGYQLIRQSTEGRRPFAYSVGASGYLDAEKRWLRGLRGLNRVRALAAMTPKLLPVALWTGIPYLLSILMKAGDRHGDFIVAFARKPTTTVVEVAGND